MPDANDENKCYKFLLKVLHPDGFSCSDCDRSVEEAHINRRRREPVVKYECPCGRVYDAFTDTPLQGTHYSCSVLVRMLDGFVRERSMKELADQLEVNRSNLYRVRKRLQGTDVWSRAGSLLGESSNETEQETAEDQEDEGKRVGRKRSTRENGAFLVLMLFNDREELLGQYNLSTRSGDFVIGSGEGADLQVEDDAIDVRHCVIRNRGESYVLQDTSSDQGTTHDGEPVDEMIIRSGDQFSIGSYRLEVERKASSPLSKGASDAGTVSDSEVHRRKMKRRGRRTGGNTNFRRVMLGFLLFAFFSVSIYSLIPEQEQRAAESGDTSRAQPIAELEQLPEQTVKVKRGGETITADGPMTIRRNDQVIMPDTGEAVVRYRDRSSRVTLRNGARVKFWNDHKTKRIHLRSGTLRGAVEHQAKGEQFVLSTPHARAEVKGTLFTLSSRKKTELQVEEGTVRMSSLETGEWVLVRSQEYASVMPDRALRHGRLTSSGGKKNRSPEADAGANQELTDRNGNGTERVTLNGSGSTDPDGSIEKYVWTKDGEQLAGGPAPQVTLPFSTGTHQVKLTVTDDLGASATDTLTVTVQRNPDAEPETIWAINAGGSSFISSEGVRFGADVRVTGGTASLVEGNIVGTEDDTIYRSERYGNFQYKLPVTDGTYRVTLKFAEIYWRRDGERVFNVLMEGKKVVSDLDIHERVGFKSALDVTRTVEVRDGTLNIEGVPEKNYAQVCGIRVQKKREER